MANAGRARAAIASRSRSRPASIASRCRRTAISRSRPAFASARRNRADQRQPDQVGRRITMNRWIVSASFSDRCCSQALVRQRARATGASTRRRASLVVEEIPEWLAVRARCARRRSWRQDRRARRRICRPHHRSLVGDRRRRLLPYQSRRRLQARLRRAGVRVADPRRSQDRLRRAHAGRRGHRHAAARDRRLHRSARAWHRAAAAVAIHASEPSELRSRRPRSRSTTTSSSPSRKSM